MSVGPNFTLKKTMTLEINKILEIKNMIYENFANKN